MSELKRKTQPMFSASPLALANAQRLIDKAVDLKHSESSPLSEAVYEILVGMGFLIKQTDELRTEVKWNTESTINTELKTREIDAEQKHVKAELEKLQGSENRRSEKWTILGWIADKGWALICIILAAGLGGAVTWILNISTQGTP